MVTHAATLGRPPVLMFATAGNKQAMEMGIRVALATGEKMQSDSMKGPRRTVFKPSRKLKGD